MRTSNINIRVEPETARGLTWLTNKYNYEHKAAFTKTDIVELLICFLVLLICVFDWFLLLFY